MSRNGRAAGAVASTTSQKLVMAPSTSDLSTGFGCGSDERRFATMRV